MSINPVQQCDTLPSLVYLVIYDYFHKYNILLIQNDQPPVQVSAESKETGPVQDDKNVDDTKTQRRPFISQFFRVKETAKVSDAQSAPDPNDLQINPDPTAEGGPVDVRILLAYNLLVTVIKLSSSLLILWLLTLSIQIGRKWKQYCYYVKNTISMDQLIS